VKTLTQYLVATCQHCLELCSCKVAVEFQFAWKTNSWGNQTVYFQLC